MRRSPLRRPPAGVTAGMTLIEIAIAIGILGLLLAGLFAAMTTSMRASVLTREHQAASEWASQQLDRLMTTPEGPNAGDFQFADSVIYADVPIQTGAGTVNLPVPNPLPTNPAWAQARAGRIEIDHDPLGFGNATGAGLDSAAIRITVAWRDSGGQNRQVELTSLRSR